MLKWVSDKSLSRYFKEIMRYPLLTREEEEALGLRARVGDVIIRVNGNSCGSPRTLASYFRQAGPGGKVALTVIRGEQELDLNLEIPVLTPQAEDKSPIEILGLQVIKISQLEPTQQTLMSAKRGLVVIDVKKGSPAAAADLRDYNREARDKLILHNLRWVVTISKQYQNRGLPLAELINEGNLGLIQAVSKFDERRKTRLTTYSNWWIRYYIVTALASRHLIKMPIKMRNLARQIRDSYGKLAQRYGRSPSLEEIARELGVEPEEVSSAFNCGVAELSIDALPFEDSKVTFEEVLKDTSSPSPAELSAKDQIERDVRSSLDETLADRELYVVSRHFGIPLPGKRVFGMESISKIFGEPADKVKHILCTASRKILSSMYHGLGEENFKRYAKLTSRDIDDLPELIPAGKKDECVSKSILRIMRKVIKHVSSMISDHFEVLTLIEQEMFILFWNVTPAREDLNLRELGDLLGVSREAARQVKERAIKKLKKKLKPHAFDDFFREAV